MDDSRRWVIRAGSGLEAVLIVSGLAGIEEIADQVSRAGYRVFVTAPGVVAAVLAALRCRFIVLLDDLPGEDRDQVLARIAEHGIAPAHIASDVAPGDVLALLADRLR